VRGGLEAKAVRSRSWVAAAVAAFLGWLFATLLLVAGMRPLGWVLLAAAVVTLAVTTLYARASRFRPFEVFGFTFAYIVLEWPLLALDRNHRAYSN
jgi:uncharacterized membrane protein YjjB (DUF3815 family)